ncbi:MAG: glycosyltransferase [Epsilonproteobacteria bacterium]|nr:glycosyltransferase [Campylobacterota bacterium]
MKKRLESYRNIVGDEVIAKIYRKAGYLYGKEIININSTYQGGGVAELLDSLIPLLNDAGADVGWDIFHGNTDFFQITKKFHNALQGAAIDLTDIKKQNYIEATQNFFSYQKINQNLVVVHDPQPLPIISFYKKRQPWIWRCHVDLSNPYPPLFEFLKEFILRYDLVIVSSEKYRKPDLPINQIVVHPAIDPLSLKNMDLTEKYETKYLHKFGIPSDKPIITQISRFDRWKDPLGVVEIYKRVKEKVNCRLVLCGNMASDDPEGWNIYEEVKRKANRLIDTGDIILIVQDNNILVNMLQRVSSVIIQKSLKEGFGLTVTEAMWKYKPVVASNVGGIPIQIVDRESGLLFDPNDLDGFSNAIVAILKNREFGERLGNAAHNRVKKHFLITRLVADYLDIAKDLINI